MEVSGIALRRLPCVSGVGFRRDADTHFAESSIQVVSGALRRQSSKLSFASFARGSRALSRSRRLAGVCKFSANGHSQFYTSLAEVCGGKQKEKEREKEKKSEAKEIKKRLKLIKGLSKNLSAFSGMGFGIEAEYGMAGEVKGKKISEAAETLLAQLQQLKAEEKELKRRRKEEKAAKKAARMKAVAGRHDSNSESSDSECGEVVDMSRLRTAVLPAPQSYQPQAILVEAPPTTLQTSTTQVESRTALPSPCGNDCSACSGSATSVAVSTSAERIEVCMGGKCKKSGGMELLAEFERMVGIEGAVVGCKCMGKCREGPNVRVLNGGENGLLNNGESPSRAASNPLCLGVRLDDVGTIVANFFGDKKDAGLVPV